MDNAKPISEWRNDPLSIERQVLAENKPLFLTGEKQDENLVIMSEKTLNELLLDMKLCEKATEAHLDYLNTGKFFSLEEVDKSIRRMIKNERQ